MWILIGNKVISSLPSNKLTTASSLNISPTPGRSWKQKDAFYQFSENILFFPNSWYGSKRWKQLKLKLKWWKLLQLRKTMDSNKDSNKDSNNNNNEETLNSSKLVSNF